VLETPALIPTKVFDVAGKEICALVGRACFQYCAWVWVLVGAVDASVVLIYSCVLCIGIRENEKC